MATVQDFIDGARRLRVPFILPMYVFLILGYEISINFLADIGFVADNYRKHYDPFYRMTFDLFWVLGLMLVNAFFPGKTWLSRIGIPIPRGFFYHLTNVVIYLTIALTWGEQVIRPTYHDFAYKSDAMSRAAGKGLTTNDLIASIDTIMLLYYAMIGAIIISYIISVAVFVIMSKRDLRIRGDRW